MVFFFLFEGKTFCKVGGSLVRDVDKTESRLIRTGTRVLRRFTCKANEVMITHFLQWFANPSNFKPSLRAVIFHVALPKKKKRSIQCLFPSLNHIRDSS